MLPLYGAKAALPAGRTAWGKLQNGQAARASRKPASKEILPAAKFVAKAFLSIFDRQKRSPAATCKPLGLQPCDWICRSRRARQIHLQEAKIASDFLYIRAIFAVVGFVSALSPRLARDGGPYFIFCLFGNLQTGEDPRLVLLTEAVALDAHSVANAHLQLDDEECVFHAVQLDNFLREGAQ